MKLTSQLQEAVNGTCTIQTLIAAAQIFCQCEGLISILHIPTTEALKFIYDIYLYNLILRYDTVPQEDVLISYCVRAYWEYLLCK